MIRKTFSFSGDDRDEDGASSAPTGMKITRRALVAGLAVALAGCSSTQRFRRPPQYLRQFVDYPAPQHAGTIIIDPRARFLYLVYGNGKALRYGVGVGRQGFGWAGTAEIKRKEKWPTWTPPKEMVEHDPKAAPYKDGMPGGLGNPLGARALSLSGQQGHALPHSRHQRAEEHRQGGLLRLHPHAQSGRHRSLRPRAARLARGRAERRQRHPLPCDDREPCADVQVRDFFGWPPFETALTRLLRMALCVLQISSKPSPDDVILRRPRQRPFRRMGRPNRSWPLPALLPALAAFRTDWLKFLGA